ncbi:MAG TPA: FG-GAP-like repeat-containing protein [Bryobacteraceae bacterium]|nr:FG-GAP-like repeat-containing protein [Bryobacteraceae bacterium]
MSLGPDPVGPIASLPQKRRSATAGLPPTGEAAQGFIAADVNGDGIPDQIDVDSGGVGVQLVAANDTVLSSTDFPTGFTPDPAFTTIVAADFNGDGKIDLAVSDPGTPGSNAGGVAVLLGNGDGTFQTPKYFPAGQNPGSLAAADFNGDGKIDLAAASTAGASIVILDGNGDGTFGTPVNYAPGGDSQATPASILALDLNGDGRPDLAVANHGFATVPNSSISVLLNTGGGFQPKFNAPLKLPLQPDYLGWADLNGDGHPDLVAVSTEASGMIVLYGNGDGTFQEPSGYSTGNSPGSLVIQTLGDGNSILMTADQITGNIWMTVVSPQGEVGAPPMHLLGGAPTGIAVADLNGDGQADAVVTGGASDVSVLLSSSGQFQTPVGYSLAQSSPMPQSVTTGDLNNDGKPDLVVASQAGLVSALLGNGDGTFQAPANIQVNQGAQSIALADLDRDHNLDAVVAAWGSQAGPGGGAIVPLLGKGDGTFQAQPALTVSGLNPSSVAAADLNSDGIPDIAAVLISSIQFGSATLAVFPGNGDGTFQSPRTFALKAPAASFTKVIGNLSAIVIGDWNGDGHPDIAVVCQADKTSIDVLLGDGKGNFTEAATLPATEDDPVSIATADLNGDGKPDLVVAHQGGEATYLLGNGDGSFQPEAQLPTGMSPAALAIISASTYNDIVSADSVGALTAVTLPVASFAPEVTMSSVASAAYGTIQLVAPASIATVYGSNLAASVGDTSTTVSVTDSSGAQQTAPLFYVGPGQINFLLADNTAQGIAQVTVTNSIGQSTVNVPVVNVSPGVFELNGSGLAAAVVLIVGPNNSVSYANVYQLDSSNNILSLPIDLSLGQVYLEIYGTGIRNAKSVTVQVGGTNVPVLSSGAQGQYPGLDQVNIGPLPASLAGGGVTNIVLAADGQTANTVNVTFR